MLYIMQGVPGSGKSYVASHMQFGLSNCVVFSTDDYHYENGEYKFKPEKLGEFHELNYQRTVKFLQEGKTVIVDNTNLQRWTVKKYVQFAVENNIPVVFIRVTGNFQNTHGVPPEKIEQMKAAIENLTVESVPWE